MRLDRVGLFVRGYGVADAHLIIVPQQDPHHVTSDRFAPIVGGWVAFDISALLLPIVRRSMNTPADRHLTTDRLASALQLHFAR